MDTPTQVSPGIDPILVSPTRANSNSGKNVLILIIILIVGVAAWFGYGYLKVPKTAVVASAPQGELVAGLPLNIILFKDAQILGSHERTLESIKASSRVLTVSYRTEASPGEVFRAYNTYMKDNNYDAERGETASPAVTRLKGIRRVPEYSSLNVFISEIDEDTTEVKISLSTPIKK